MLDDAILSTRVLAESSSADLLFSSGILSVLCDSDLRG